MTAASPAPRSRTWIFVVLGALLLSCSCVGGLVAQYLYFHRDEPLGPGTRPITPTTSPTPSGDDRDHGTVDFPYP